MHIYIYAHKRTYASIYIYNAHTLILDVAKLAAEAYEYAELIVLFGHLTIVLCFVLSNRSKCMTHEYITTIKTYTVIAINVPGTLSIHSTMNHNYHTYIHIYVQCTDLISMYTHIPVLILTGHLSAQSPVAAHVFSPTYLNDFSIA